MDKVFIQRLKVPAIIGIYDQEKAAKQDLWFDLECASNIKAAAKSDNIADALDYATIAKRLTHFIGDSHFQLIETLAEKIAALLQEEFKVTWLRLTIYKRPFDIDNVEFTGIIIERDYH